MEEKKKRKKSLKGTWIQLCCPKNAGNACLPWMRRLPILHVSISSNHDVTVPWPRLGWAGLGSVQPSIGTPDQCYCWVCRWLPPLGTSPPQCLVPNFPLVLGEMSSLETAGTAAVLLTTYNKSRKRCNSINRVLTSPLPSSHPSILPILLSSFCLSSKNKVLILIRHLATALLPRS